MSELFPKQRIDLADAWTRSDDEAFSRPLIAKLTEALELRPLPHLTANENEHLLVLIQTTLEVSALLHILMASTA